MAGWCWEAFYGAGGQPKKAKPFRGFRVEPKEPKSREVENETSTSCSHRLLIYAAACLFDCVQHSAGRLRRATAHQLDGRRPTLGAVCVRRLHPNGTTALSTLATGLACVSTRCFPYVLWLLYLLGCRCREIHAGSRNWCWQCRDVMAAGVGQGQLTIERAARIPISCRSG